MGSTAAKRKAWAVASLGGLSAMVLGAVFPGAVASGAGPEGRARQPVDPDAAPADDVSTGAFQSCSAYYGWGKSWAHVDVAVDGTVDDSIQYPADYDLVLTGELDGVPGDESCTPELLTQADWDFDFPGNAPPYSNVASLPPGSNIVIPGQTLLSAVTGPELQLSFDGEFPGRTIEVDSAALPNFQDPATYDAEYQAYLVAAIGAPLADAFSPICLVAPSQDAQDAAAAAFAAMDPAFQDEFEDIAGNTDFSTCFNYGNIEQWFRLYWFPYTWGTDNPVTFELATTPAAAPIVIEPTFTG